MGALTLKSFPFELRGWDIKSYDSIDPTDSFGQNTRVYVENNQILKIEPSFSNNQSNNWITDKGRHFFDSLFDTETLNSQNLIKSNQTWEKLFKIIQKSLYTLNMCNLKFLNKHFFIIIFEFLSIESLNLLYTITQSYQFIKLKRAEIYKINNNIESSFQLQSSTGQPKMFFSSLCLLIGTNTRYENSYLNLQLRQRNLKGNFKILSIGSLFDFTFPVSFLGSNFLTLKTIIEGNSSSCQDLKTAENPMLITNTEIFKRNDSKNLINLIKILKFTNIISKIWNGINTLNSNISEVGTNSLTLFPFLNIQDLTCSNSLYIINAKLLNIKNLKKLTELKLLEFITLPKDYRTNLLLIDQNTKKTNVSLINDKKLFFKKYIYMPSNSFFENHETFLNTEGNFKRATKLIVRSKTKSNWQLIRKFAKKLNILTNKHQPLIFDTKNQHAFKNYINFQFYATQSFIDLNFYLNLKNNSFIIYKKFLPFKTVSTKVFNTKIKYWLDDFFNGAKDSYCKNSLILTNCSVNIRTQSTNFF